MVDTDRVQRLERLPQLFQVPVLGVALGRRPVHVGGDDVDHHVVRLLRQVLALEDHPALFVDDGPLPVHHLVVLEDVLADLEVLLLHLGLRALDGAGDHLGLDRHILGQVQPGQQGLQRRAVEAPHQLVAQRQVEPGFAGIALPARATTQLVVDAAGLVALGAQHVEPTGGDDLFGLGLRLGLDLADRRFPGGLVLLRGGDRVQALIPQPLVGQELDVAAEHDVGTAAGHVGRHGDGAAAAGLGDDVRLGFVVLRVQHVVRHPALGELARQVLRTLDRGGADQDRLALLVALHHIVDDGDVLGFLGLVDQVGLVDADHRPVGRDADHPELVDLVQLGRLGLGGTGHAGELVVEPEVVLQRDGRQRLVLGLDLDVLLGLDGLVHALVVAPAHQHAAGELVDDDDLTVAHDVVLVAQEQFLGLQAVVQVADQRRIRGLVEVLDAQLVLDELDAELMHTDGALAQVDFVVDVLLHQRGQPGELAVPVRGAVGGAGDDQRRAGLVDEDRVDLVDDAVVVSALHHLLYGVGHVVAQIVEAELVVRSVGDVGGVGRAALVGGQPGQDDADVQPEKAVDAAHLLAVAFGQIVVDGDQVHTLARQRVEVCGQHAGQGLALTGLHLGHIAEVQRRATHQLDGERLLPQHPPGGLTGHRERLGQQVVEVFTAGNPFAEFVGLGA